MSFYVHTKPTLATRTRPKELIPGTGVITLVAAKARAFGARKPANSFKTAY